MTLRGVRKLQLISVILYGCSFFLAVMAVLLQRVFRPLFYSTSSASDLFIVPWYPLAGTFLIFALALVFLLFCRTIRSARASRIAVIVIFVAWIVHSLLVSPLVSLLVNSAVNSFGLEYITSYSVVTRIISLFVSLPSFAGSLLMLLAMGGFFGKGRDADAPDDGMTVRGVRGLLITAAGLCALGLLMFLFIILLRGAFLELFGTPESLYGHVSDPLYDLLNLLRLLPMIALVVISLLLVLRRRSAAGARKVTVLMSVLRAALYLLSVLFSFLVILFMGRIRGNYALSAYSILSSVFSVFVSPFVSAAGMVMLLALGGYYGKETALR